LLEIFEDLENDPPKLIISGPISRVPAHLDRLINEKYAPVESFGAFTVLQRFSD
jgi:hypothetical protein